jgi:hypothetical protein
VKLSRVTDGKCQKIGGLLNDLAPETQHAYTYRTAGLVCRRTPNLPEMMTSSRSAQIAWPTPISMCPMP